MATTSTTEVANLLQSIREFHSQSDRKIARYFRKPLPEETIQKLIAQIGLPVPQEWYDMYRCFNGVDPGDSLSLHAGTVLLNWPWERLEEVVNLRNSMAPRWGPSENQQLYFGIGTGVPWIGLDFTKTQNGIVPVVVGRVQRPRLIAFDDIRSMLATVAAAYERGIVSYDAEQRVTYDRAAMVRVVEEFNERGEYWTHVR